MSSPYNKPENEGHRKASNSFFSSDRFDNSSCLMWLLVLIVIYLPWSFEPGDQPVYKRVDVQKGMKYLWEWLEKGGVRGRHC